MKNNVKYVKAVPYQDILNLAVTLEQLQSWQEPLKVLEEYFNNRSLPLNKKKITREYHSSSQLFHLFLKDYEQLIDQLAKEIHTLKIQNKLKME